MIKNPILKGFNPDPSILRVDDDYYIATSTFEWFPGVQIHHSRDLVNWELLTRPLDRASQLDMIGNPDSGGIWAPCLSFDKGVFYLIYTDTKQWNNGPHKISHNYLITATDINGPWSEPTYMDSSGFDASLFHDDDGRKWYISMIWDHRKGNNEFSGTLLQEYCSKENKLIGPRKNIYKGTSLGLVEGPHLYKRNGYYYLLVAEGGTWYTHAATFARSKEIDGPYETEPNYPFLTSVGSAEDALQKAGHASIVETQNGEWYVVHLCGRPKKEKRCMLGRETSIQKCKWNEDGWLKLEQGGKNPLHEAEAPKLPLHPFPEENLNINFDSTDLNIHLQSLRRPIDDSWLDLKSRSGWLRLYGEEPTTSNFHQSLIARRIQSFDTITKTSVDFQPDCFKHMAGLVAYYDTKNHYYLRITHEEGKGRVLNIIQSDSGEYDEVLDSDISIPDEGVVYLKAEITKGENLQYSYSMDEQEWNDVGPVLDASKLSDDYFTLGFTGAFIGLCCQDLTGQKHPADFGYLNYEELN